MKRRNERTTKAWTRSWLGAVAVVALSSWGACSSDDDPEGTGGTGGTGGRPDGSSASGGGGGRPPVQCGSQTCAEVPADLASNGVVACCATTDVCGLQTPLAEGCLLPEPNAGVDPSCPSFTIPGIGLTMQGCCAPGGECGAFDDFMGLGCIKRADLGEAPEACDYDPNNRCTWLAELPCDGPEDCPGTQVCCGHFEGSGYTEFACRDACGEGDGGQTDLWLELCHPGQTCADTTMQCLSSQYLPSFMYRCYTDGTEPGAPGSTAADVVNCGSAPCATGEKCCLREPGDPYCAPAGDTCVCNPGAGSGGAAGASGAAGDSGAAGAAGAAGAGGAAGAAGSP